MVDSSEVGPGRRGIMTKHASILGSGASMSRLPCWGIIPHVSKLLVMGQSNGSFSKKEKKKKTTNQMAQIPPSIIIILYYYLFGNFMERLSAVDAGLETCK
jgi:hypothetical protein